MTPIQKMQSRCSTALMMLYQAEAGMDFPEAVEFYRGLYHGMTAMLDELGVEYESYDPDGYKKYELVD